MSRKALILMVCLGLAGCAAAQPRARPRPPTDEDKRAVAQALGPLLQVSGLWRSREDGCAVALAILPAKAINLGVAPHPSCRFGLLVTEGALEGLPPEELQAALAHEIGHVQLGHFAARKSRRATEGEEKRRIDEAGSTSGAVAAAIPVIGPLVALGIMGGQVASETSAEGTYRAYDREEELAADRFALGLLGRLPGVGRCRALLALLERLERERRASLWSDWLSTHPSPGARLASAKASCS
jgi:Zn-dependent protease with chaperone function